jgi:hypothetical protein
MSLAELIEKRALEGYTLSRSKKPADRARGGRLIDASRVACEIMGEHVPDLDKESRIKRLFLDVIAPGRVYAR